MVHELGETDHVAEWQADGSTSDVDFSIDYEFRSRMLGIVMGGLFDTAFRRFAEAFERRADLVYGVASRRSAPAT